MTNGARLWRSRRVVLPDGERPACVVVRDGRIESVEPWDAGRSVSEDLGELVLLPGLVDSHVHVNEPGRAGWEGFRTATLAAAAGGVTTIVDMPLNSIPATTTEAALRAKVAAMTGKLHVDAGLWGGVVPGNAGDLAALAAAGVLGFKCFLSPSGVDEFGHVGERELREALPALAALGLPLLAHAEDPALLLPLHGSTRRHADWLGSRPPEAEAGAIGMLARLAGPAGVHVHVVHVASSAAVAAIAAATAAGVSISAETCPHYLTFAAGEIADGATLFKCAPPIRAEAERLALVQALRTFELDMVVSDHSPAPADLKDLEGGDFARAWGGIASLELGLAATWTVMRGAGANPSDLARWMSAEPARLAGLFGRKGAIAPGFDADFAAFAPDERWTVEAVRLRQRHAFSPYVGRTLQGRVHATWLRGVNVFRDGQAPGAPSGRWLTREDRAVDPFPPLP